MITVAEARARILAAVPGPAAEHLSLAEAAGRVLLGPILARRTQPPVDVSAMDGWAVRAIDGLPGRDLQIIGESAAGSGFTGEIGPDQAVRIFTGAPLPLGADAVVLQEDATRSGERVRFGEAARPGRHIRRRGQDFAAGTTLLAGPRRLGPRDIALLAAADIPWLTVARRPRVAIIATGNELVRPGEPAGPHQIISSNSYALAALVRAAGGEPIDCGIIPDDLGALRATIRAAAQADLIITLGGASVGDHDLVKPALEQEGARLDFWKIAMRPGKPMLFGTLGRALVLGLPGNPVSAFVCAYLFLKPAIEACLGLDPAEPLVKARLLTDLPANGPRAHYLRADLHLGPEGWQARPLVSQDSALQALLAEATGLIIQPIQAPAQAAGSLIDALPLAFGY